MNWYRKVFNTRPMYFEDFPFSPEPFMVRVDEPTSPSFDEWMALIQGLEMWLSDPYLELKIARPKGHIDCPCWRTGMFKRVEGCKDHPWDL
jgi:hypothetical protein